MAEHSYKGSLQGTVGETHAWDGPIDLDQFPQVKGSNRGPNGCLLYTSPSPRDS